MRSEENEMEAQKWLHLSHQSYILLLFIFLGTSTISSQVRLQTHLANYCAPLSFPPQASLQTHANGYHQPTSSKMVPGHLG